MTKDVKRPYRARRFPWENDSIEIIYVPPRRLSAMDRPSKAPDPVARPVVDKRLDKE